MVIRKTLVALASLGLVIGTSAMAAAPAKVDNVRKASPVADSEGIAQWTWFLALVILIGVIGVALADTEQPASP